MTSLLPHALRAAQGRAPAPQAARRAIVAGAAGPLGSLVLEQLLAGGVFQEVQALVVGPLAPALRGLAALHVDELARGAAPRADTAVVVFDRERFSFGREAAFARVPPQDLPALAASLHQAGVAHLVVVLPQAPALLPQALRAGLASLDERSVAALGFAHVVFIRPAQEPSATGPVPLPWLPRLARWWLAQLRWMVPQRDQPVRAAKVAPFVAQVAGQLPQARPGTRVAGPEWVWLAAQPGGSAAEVARHWLQGGADFEALAAGVKGQRQRGHPAWPSGPPKRPQSRRKAQP
jgi:hypothetical protein